ncbi:hypothetical protein [Abiotrophia defectiva]|uniref:hypothetical protein n=1 Tax=Abiotrophia defectiva TaxID=46125 RepID=UPI0030D3A5E3
MNTTIRIIINTVIWATTWTVVEMMIKKIIKRRREKRHLGDQIDELIKGLHKLNEILEEEIDNE